MRKLSPIERLREQSGIGNMHYSRSVLGIVAMNGEELQGAGSALLVGFPDHEPEFALVSARHVVSAFGTADTFAEISYPGDNRRFRVERIQVPSKSWTLSEDDDIACAPFPVELLSNDHLVRCVHVDHLTYTSFSPTPDLKLVGRWGEGSNDTYILSRNGQLASMERPAISVAIGSDKERVEQPMYFVDATVSRGMSGGAAFVEMTPPTVMGLLSAHGVLPPPSSAIKKLPEGAQTVALALWESIGPINSGLAYLVPVDRVRDFLLRTVWKNSR